MLLSGGPSKDAQGFACPKQNAYVFCKSLQPWTLRCLFVYWSTQGVCIQSVFTTLSSLLQADVCKPVHILPMCTSVYSGDVSRFTFCRMSATVDACVKCLYEVSWLDQDLAKGVDVRGLPASQGSRRITRFSSAIGGWIIQLSSVA